MTGDCGDRQAKRLLHIKLVKGRWYWDPPDRLRKSHGLVTKPLGGNQLEAWAYVERLNVKHLQLSPGAPRVGTVRWVIEQFIASTKFASLAASTQRDYRWLGERVLAPLRIASWIVGDLPPPSLRPRHANRIYAAILEQRGPAAAHYATRLARRLWKWAGRRDMVGQGNPWEEMELQGLPARTALWTPAQVTAVVEAAEKAGRPSLGLATVLAYWLGHRQADILGLT